MVPITLRLGLFAFVHDHFPGTHKLLQTCGGQAPARSPRDAWRRRCWGRTRRIRRIRRTRGTRRTQRWLGRRRWRRIWRRMWRGIWRGIWRRGRLGCEDRLLPGRGLRRARGPRGVWPLVSQRPASPACLIGHSSPPNKHRAAPRGCRPFTDATDCARTIASGLRSLRAPSR